MGKLRWKRVFSPKARTLAQADAARDNRDAVAAAYFYLKAIDRWGADYPVLMQLGNALKDSGRFPEAEQTYFEAIAIRPSEDDAFLQLGHLMKLAGDIDRARKFYQEALDINPLNVDARAELNMIISSQSVQNVERGYLPLRIDMPHSASIVYYRLINQYRWRRG